MKKEFIQPVVLVVEINMEDVITGSNFGGSKPGDNPSDYGGFFDFK